MGDAMCCVLFVYAMERARQYVVNLDDFHVSVGGHSINLSNGITVGSDKSSWAVVNVPGGCNLSLVVGTTLVGPKKQDIGVFSGFMTLVADSQKRCMVKLTHPHIHYNIIDHEILFIRTVGLQNQRKTVGSVTREYQLVYDQDDEEHRSGRLRTSSGSAHVGYSADGG